MITASRTCTDSRGRDEAVKSWTGAFIGSGPIVIYLASPVAQTGGSASLVAGTAEGSVVHFPVDLLPTFLRSHQSEIFVSPDGTALFAAITAYPNPRQPEAALVWACLGASRWLTLGDLDLLVRVANGMSVCKTRPEEAIAAHYKQKTGPGADNRSQTDPDPDQKSPHRGRIRRILGVFDSLNADLGRMHEETTLPSEPEYRLTPLPPEELESLRQQAETFLRHRTQLLRDQRIAAGLPPQAEHPGPKTPSVTGSSRVSPPGLERTFGGAGSLVRGEIATRVLLAQPWRTRLRTDSTYCFRRRLSNWKPRFTPSKSCQITFTCSLNPIRRCAWPNW